MTEQAVEDEIQNHLKVLRSYWSERAGHPPREYCFMRGISHKHFELLYLMTDIDTSRFATGK